MSLRRALATPEGKRAYVRTLFATIADRYDLITVLLSYGLDRGWKRRLMHLAGLTPDDRVLDLACGTGDLAQLARRQARRVVGLDLTHRMLQLAAGKPGAADLPLVRADMCALPFPDGRFTVLTTGYGLRNVPDLDLAAREAHRVLAPGGRLLSLDFERPANPLLRAAYLAYLTVAGSLLGLILHGDADTYRYIPASLRRYPGAAGVADILRRSGFAEVTVVPILWGLMAIHVARRT